jgi:hypothetical protein
MRSGRLDSEDLDRVSLAIVTASMPLLVMAGLVPAIHEFQFVIPAKAGLQ